MEMKTAIEFEKKRRGTREQGLRTKMKSGRLSTKHRKGIDRQRRGLEERQELSKVMEAGWSKQGEEESRGET